ncbi:MAG: carbohydrate-binding family 9-like protein [Planctomycetes bacterium]|nr:carbohydrate-binding family 9-like protein [Planctomycetota bacterium]
MTETKPTLTAHCHHLKPGAPLKGVASLLSAQQGVRLESYPWYQGGNKQATQAWVGHDAEHLFVHFECVDRHISCKPRKLNGDVCCDSCVELFASPWPQTKPHYFNLEINACGVLHLGYGEMRTNRKLVDADIADKFTVLSSFPGPSKDESPEDKGWTVTARLPFAALDKFIGEPLPHEKGARWACNFYRCGGITDPQYCCWSPIGLPNPDFHVPAFFSPLLFS